jgi:RimJ/RimL family protein N-acetyltransferase
LSNCQTPTQSNGVSNAAVATVSSLFPAHPRSLSLWDLDWRDHFPKMFGDVVVDVASFDEAIPFIAKHYGEIFQRDPSIDRFLADPLTTAKRRFGAEMDVFLLRDHGEQIGVLIGHPSDWSTYYMRSVALLASYRSRHLLSDLVESTYEPLREAGVERIEGDCSPANHAMVRALVNLGFMANSTHPTERWGIQLRFIKYLSREAEDVFVRQFCHGHNNHVRQH